MLTPEAFGELSVKFEEIRQCLNAAYVASEGRGDVPDEACGYYTLAVALMEELSKEIAKRERHGVRDVLMRMAKVAKSPTGASGAGALGGAGLALSQTGLGGFGLAAGGGALGIAGLGGAAVLSGGTALASGAAFYLAYKGVAMGLETELGQNLTDRTRAVSRRATERLRRWRSVPSRPDTPSTTGGKEMSGSSQWQVGDVNDNGLMILREASEREEGKPQLLVQHCTRCHGNCATYAHSRKRRRCPYCGDPRGGLGRPLSDANRTWRCPAGDCSQPWPLA